MHVNVRARAEEKAASETVGTAQLDSDLLGGGGARCTNAISPAWCHKS